MELSFLACPECGGKLTKGDRYFAPALVRCGHCGETVDSGFREWAHLSLFAKSALALLEVLAPSFMAIASGRIRIFMNAFFFVALWAVASNFADEQGVEDSLAAMVGLLAALLYLAFLVVRLFRLIRESNRFTETGEIPTWRYKW